MFDKILISSCFLGKKVRYNGKVISFIHHHIIQWQQQQRLIAICPEVNGGLAVPREPAEQQNKLGKVITVSGQDVSHQFKSGAQQALALCQKYDIYFALLKESSPSCGSTSIYDGSFSNQKVTGKGITTLLLEEHGIKVFSEYTIENLADSLKIKEDNKGKG